MQIEESQRDCANYAWSNSVGKTIKNFIKESLCATIVLLEKISCQHYLTRCNSLCTFASPLSSLFCFTYNVTKKIHQYNKNKNCWEVLKKISNYISKKLKEKLKVFKNYQLFKDVFKNYIINCVSLSFYKYRCNYVLYALL